MPLSCGCDNEYEPGTKVVYYGEDFEPLQASRRKRCQSCNALIDIGALAVQFQRFKVPDSEIEVNIYGEDGEIPLAPHYVCEKCGEIYLNLLDLGFECITPYENMRDLLKEYQDTYNPPKLSKKQ